MAQVMVLRDELEPELRKRLLEKNRKISEDFAWIFSNIENLRKEFPDKYIAVEDKTVKFSAETIEALMSKIKEANRITDDFSIKYVKAEEATLLL